MLKFWPKLLHGSLNQIIRVFDTVLPIQPIQPSYVISYFCCRRTWVLLCAFLASLFLVLSPPSRILKIASTFEFNELMASSVASFEAGVSTLFGLVVDMSKNLLSHSRTFEIASWFEYFELPTLLGSNSKSFEVEMTVVIWILELLVSSVGTSGEWVVDAKFQYSFCSMTIFSNKRRVREIVRRNVMVYIWKPCLASFGNSIKIAQLNVIVTTRITNPGQRKANLRQYWASSSAHLGSSTATPANFDRSASTGRSDGPIETDMHLQRWKHIGRRALPPAEWFHIMGSM